MKKGFNPHQSTGIPLPVSFFEDKDKTILRKTLLSEDAKRLSEFFVENKHEKMSIHQLRKLYHQLLNIRERIEIKQDKEQEFKRQLPYIKMLKAQAVYAEARKNITQNFRVFIERQVDEINDRRDFDTLCDLFEAIVAFATADKRYKKK